MDYIGFDLGTGALKAVRTDEDFQLRAHASREVPLRYVTPEQIEIDAEAYRALVWEMLRELAAAPGEEIGGIAFAAASGNTMLCDNSGRALTPIISWLDHRLHDWFPPREWEVRRVTGWPALDTFPMMHLEFFRRTAPELLHSAQITMNNEYLTWQLTGKRGLDPSSATPFYLADQEKMCYYRTYLDYYGLREEQLPPLRKSGSLIGTLLPEYCTGALTERTRVVTGSFDHPSAARAVGIRGEGDLLISCGTSWVGFYTAKTRQEVPDAELCDPYLVHDGGCWGGMFSLSSIGLSLEKFITENFGHAPERYDRFNEAALQPGSPSAALMRETIRRFRAKLGTRKVCRAVMTGGPSQGVAWKKYLAEELCIPVTASPYRNYTGAAGAAMIAAGTKEK